MKAVIFDLDGVIADTAKYHFSAWKQLIWNHFGVDIPDTIEANLKGVSREESLMILLQHIGKTVDEVTFKGLCDEKNRQYMASLANISKDEILPGIALLILDLQKRGIRMALASASKNAPFILEKLGLKSQFYTIIDPHQIVAGKPAPDIFLAAVAALGCSADECIGIEDSVAGIEAINKAGCISIGVSDEELPEAFCQVGNTSELSYERLLEVSEQFHRLKSNCITK
ncbi:beta-phosphoglucomutase [Streptococcus cuniculi]|uniref:Beta-phosphoglucomutase n=2 Tax=Streptococcus cuniculi TaxID=1432788 RepID=A0A1Q8E7J5_9STRE|nr:beta-phosphoglucomutase [Streptococcus cuniculi]